MPLEQKVLMPARPIPGQKFVQPMSRMGGDAGEDIGEPGLRVDAVHFAVMMRLYLAAVRRPPRSDPQNSQDFRPRAMPRNPLSAALLEAHTSVPEE